MNKKLLFILMLFFGCLTFSGCSKEEESEKDSAADNDIKDVVTVSGKVGNYSYVDLGLSVKWATCNVGASSPVNHGYYFSWGENKAKDSYTWSNYKLCKNAIVDSLSNVPKDFSKYCLNSYFGNVDSLTVLSSEDDAVVSNYGKEWRMPTEEEMQALADSCEWKWTDNFNGSGVAGQVGRSKVNGNSIFFPASGCVDGVSKSFVGVLCYYWSSSLSSGNNGNAKFLYINSDRIAVRANYRYIGCQVRAVTEK